MHVLSTDWIALVTTGSRINLEAVEIRRPGPVSVPS